LYFLSFSFFRKKLKKRTRCSHVGGDRGVPQGVAFVFSCVGKVPWACSFWTTRSNSRSTRGGTSKSEACELNFAKGIMETGEKTFCRTQCNTPPLLHPKTTGKCVHSHCRVTGEISMLVVQYLKKVMRAMNGGPGTKKQQNCTVLQINSMNIN